MTSTEGKPRAVWLGLLVIFIVSLLPRLIYPVSRPMQWYPRSVRFWNALLDRDLGGTYQWYHPGVTTMWVAGLGLRVHAWAQGWSGEELLTPPETSGDHRPYPIAPGVAALSIFIALGISLAYFQLTRLFGWRLGMVAGLLMALDPFYTEQSKVLHVDAPLATLMLLSALFLVGYLKTETRQELILSGCFAGLAFLTKSPSAFLIPSAVGTVVYVHLVGDKNARGSAVRRRWADRIWRAIRALLLWGLVAAIVFVLFWPAMWVAPIDVLSKMAHGTGFHVETEHRNPNFFAGRVIDGDVGPFFYVATILWKTTLITLPSLLTVLPLLLLRRGRERSRSAPVWWLLAYAAGFAGAMVLPAGKEMRYLLPIFPALDVLAAWGLLRSADAIGQQKALQPHRRAPSLMVAGLLAVQGVAVLRQHPYYGTHHNLLLGGSRVAQHVLPLGDQGEGQDLAAHFLASLPRAEDRMIGVHRRYEELFERIFPGRSEGLEDPYIDYYVFGINSIQRQNRLELWDDAWELCQEKTPLWTASFDGVTYAWIYGGFESEPEAFAIDHPMDVEAGEHIRLLGYSLSPSEPSPEASLRVKLFWQSDGRLERDYHVFVHLLDEQGDLVAQHDGVPRQGQRPSWDWRYLEVIEDGHRIPLHDVQGGKSYDIYAGIYDFGTKNRLSMTGPDGEVLPHNRVRLQPIEVVQRSGADR